MPSQPGTQRNPNVNHKQGPSVLQRISNAITGSLEKGFYRLGRVVGRSPWMTIILSLIICGACLAGLANFTRESRGEKLWVPDNSQGFKDKEWVDKTFPAKSTQASFLLQGENVLSSEKLTEMLRVHNEIVNITITFEKKQLSWQDICFKRGRICSVAGLLELWSFNVSIIEKLTNEEILEKVNEVQNGSVSPYSKSPFNLERVLGDIKYSNGKISGAKVLKGIYYYESMKELDEGSGEEVDERGEIWEEEFGKIMEGKNLVYLTLKKFAKTSQDAIDGDIVLLSSGYLLILAYIIVMLGKFTRLEIKVWIALVGIISVGLSIGVSMGLSSAFGLLYGPAHSTLPFLLLGIGVDDLFVVVQSWSNIPAHVHQNSPVEERIGLALKHAGSSITITTLTDMLAFLVGGSTIIPGLRSFCFFAAIGILSDYVLQTTFFVAWLAVDARRSDNRRDGCCCCLTLPQDYTPNKCGEKSYLQIFFEKIFAKWILKLPVKIFVVLIVLGLLGANIYGTTQLESQFEQKWFLPTGTVVREYYDINDEDFPEKGAPLGVYVENIRHYEEQSELRKLGNMLRLETKYLSKNSVEDWYERYIDWMKEYSPQDIGEDSKVNTSKAFYDRLKVFLNTSSGSRFVDDVLWSDTGKDIKASRIRALQKRPVQTDKQVDAMDSLRELAENIGFSSNPRVYSDVILFSESHKVIQKELYRNVLLAMVVVIIVTLVIIASPVTSFLVFLCVVFTVVDVAGLMYFWDLTIDTVSVVVLVIAVGLSVDYASHVGHTFLVKSGTRNERAVKTYRDIGPAVWNGGFSTLLAILPLSTSESHVFTTFFKILFGVVAFGVFHGLVFLPALLSMIGPSPYLSAQQMESSSREADDGENGVKDKNVEPVQSYTNKVIANGNGIVPNNEAFVINGVGKANEGVDVNEQNLPEKPSVVEMRL